MVHQETCVARPVTALRSYVWEAGLWSSPVSPGQTGMPPGTGGVVAGPQQNMSVTRFQRDPNRKEGLTKQT